jgi:hypothetical protein
VPATRSIVREFTWDAASLRYRRGGRFVSERAVKLAIRRTIRAAAAEIRGVTADVAAGRVTVADWQARMAGELKNLHLASAMAARGGRRNMTPADWLRAGREIRYQLGRLGRFAADVAAGRLTERQVLARADLYVEAADGTFENARRGAAAGVYSQERNVLGAAENHCGGCLTETARGWVGLGELVPIGERACIVNCHCRYVFRGKPGTPADPLPAPGPYPGRLVVEGDVAGAARDMGLKVTDPAGVAAIGVPTDAVFKEVTVAVTPSGNVRITARGPDGSHADRTIYRGDDGRPAMSNSELELPASARGGGGTAHFAGQVANARRAGVSRIDTYAARADGRYNGYYTWPRLGYDARLPDLGRTAELARPASVAGATTLREVMADPAGRDWWRRHGRGTEMTFDLRRGSDAVRALRDYLAERRDRPK